MVSEVIHNALEIAELIAYVIRYIIAFYLLLMGPSLTDWIQAFCAIAGLFASGIGIFYVVRSFQEQTRINQRQEDFNIQQLALVRIEQNRAAREVRPVFHIKHGSPPTRDTLGMYYEFYCTGSPALGVCAEFLSYSNAAKYSLQLSPGKSLGNFFPVDIDANSRKLHFYINANSQDRATIRFHFLDVDQRAGYADYELSLGVGWPVTGFAATAYPGVNKISETLEGQPPMEFLGAGS